MQYVRSTLINLYLNLFFVILLTIFLVLGLLSPDFGSWRQWLSFSCLVISSLLNFIFLVKNIKDVFQKYKNEEIESVRSFMKILKFTSIPYFILNFLLYAFIFFIFFAASRGIIIFSPIPLMFLIPAFFTYLSVLFTSPYGIGFICILYKRKKINTIEFAVHLLFQLCFVLDVVDTVILLKKYKIQKSVN